MTRVLTGDCREVLTTLETASVSACVTDPPYGLTANNRASVDLSTPYGRARAGRGGFMGAAWDASIPDASLWSEVLRVLKPGAHLVAFGGTRTWHRLAVAIEDAGFAIRDTLMFLYGAGFPKSHNVGGGRGTALKPAYEPIILARKPLAGTVAHNVELHGTGALNIDACRVPHVTIEGGTLAQNTHLRTSVEARATSTFNANGNSYTPPASGRWPANVVLDGEAAAALDAQTGELTSGKTVTRRQTVAGHQGVVYGAESRGPDPVDWYGDTGGASRFFYTSKASRRERERGLEQGTKRVVSVWGGDEDDLTEGKKSTIPRANNHPCVKPVDLMRWLVRLVTPPNGLVLDPFCGSGSTGVAAVLEDRRFLGIEREPEYVEIATRRIARAAEQGSLFRDAEGVA